MKLFNRILNDEQGVLTFEWILLLALLVIGIVGGLAAVRDGLLIQLGSSAAVIVGIDQSTLIKFPPIIQITVPDLYDGVVAGSSAGGSVNHAYGGSSIDADTGEVTRGGIEVHAVASTASLDPVTYP